LLASFLIMVREGLEAALIVAILAAYLKKVGRPGLSKYLFTGAGLAALLSLITALLFGEVYSTVGTAFEGVAALVAVIVLTYMVFWMSGNAKNMHILLEQKAETAISSGKLIGLTGLAFLSVFREGIETVLFLFGLRAITTWQSIVSGVILGLILVLVLSILIFRQVYRINLRKFFTYTSAILLVFGAGILGQAVVALQSAGWLPGTITVWDTGWLLSDRGLIGSILRALIGYASAPSLLQITMYLGYLAMFGSLAWSSLDLGKKRSEAATTKAQTAACAACQTEQYTDPFSSFGRDYANPLYKLLRSKWYPNVVITALGVIFLIILVIGLFKLNVGPFNNVGPLRLGPFVTKEDENNLFNFLLWIIWLPLVSIVTLLAGRLWCGNLCPLRLVTDWFRNLADKLFGRPAHTKPYMRVGWLLPAAFILITFFVKNWPIQQIAHYGAIMFIVLIAATAAISFLFQRGTWCRYVCPIGGWLARLARLSFIGVRSNQAACDTCQTKPCIKGTDQAHRCPSFLNPSKLDSNRYCLECWNCVKNCPSEKSGMRVGLRFPGAELQKPYSPDIWESVFVFGILGMYTAVSRQGVILSLSIPWVLSFVAFITASLLVYAMLSWLVAKLGGIPFREALTNIGYIFLPFEFAIALLTFGDDALSFFGIFVPGASLLLGLGFVWSSYLATSIIKNHTTSERRTIMALIPVAIVLMVLLFMWAGWYTSGTIIDLT